MVETVTSKKFVNPLSVVLMSLLIIACVACGLLCNDRRIRQEPLQATAEAEAFLTETYGMEVSNVIENFESQLRGGGTGGRPLWYTTLASVKSARVLEYSTERFKAVADVMREMAEETAGGEFIAGSEESIRTCGVYVFVREDDTWKLVGHLPRTCPFLFVGM